MTMTPTYYNFGAVYIKYIYVKLIVMILLKWVRFI